MTRYEIDRLASSVPIAGGFGMAVALLGGFNVGLGLLIGFLVSFFGIGTLVVISGEDEES